MYLEVEETYIRIWLTLSEVIDGRPFEIAAGCRSPHVVRHSTSSTGTLSVFKQKGRLWTIQATFPWLIILSDKASLSSDFGMSSAPTLDAIAILRL